MTPTLLADVSSATGLFVQCDKDGVWIDGQRPHGMKGLGRTVKPDLLVKIWEAIPASTATKEELWAMLQRAVTPKKGASDYRPVDIGDGFGGHEHRNCTHPDLGGPCWGQVEWIEVRDLRVGRCLKPLCRGHRTARYTPA
jgi:hypothetical protein